MLLPLFSPLNNTFQLLTQEVALLELSMEMYDFTVIEKLTFHQADQNMPRGLPQA